MPKILTEKEVNDLLSWHKNVLNRLENAASFPVGSLLFDVKNAYSDLVKQHVFETAFLDSVNSDSLLNYSDDVVNFINAVYDYIETEQAVLECANCYKRYKFKINQAFDNLDRSYSMLGWFISSSKRNDASIEAFSFLSNLKNQHYALPATSKFYTRSSLSKPQHCVASDPESFFDQLRYCGIQVDAPDFLSVQITDLMNSLNDLVEQAEVVREFCTSSETEVSRMANKLMKARLDCILETTSVDILLKFKISNSGISILKNHGIVTLDKLYQLSSDTLESFRGIGNKTALKVSSATVEIIEEIRSTIKIQLSSDNKDEQSSSLVLATYVLILAKKQCHDELPTELESYCLTLSTIKTLETFINAVQWYFFNNIETMRFPHAFKEGKQILSSQWAQQTKSIYSDVECLKAKLNNQPAFISEAWSAFEEDPISFFNMIESICPDALGRDDDFDLGLPENLAREIDETKFSLSGLRCELRHYQEIGLKYILHQKKALLGDEMGLGKTIQAIAAIVSLKNAGATHFLVVCPAAVITNWCREVSKHSELNVTKIYGQDKRWRLAEWSNIGGVAVTNYESLNTILKNGTPTIDFLVVDEAHYVKNPESARSRNVAELSLRAPRLLFMTGTALENRVDEMIKLIGYLRPDIADEITSYASSYDSDAFKKTIAPVYYRRKREDVLGELPELIESDMWCELDRDEEALYEDCILRKDITGIRRVSWNVTNLKCSSKLNMLKEIVKDAEEDGRKVLVFSFYLDTLRVIHKEFGKKSFRPITGSVTSRQRQDIIDAFSRAPAGSVLPAQIMAGGTGLNIQAASIVVICEPQYKPSTESQAISRAYRMGQSRNVLTFRLLASKTFDEKIVYLLKWKQAIFDEFADESDAAKSELIALQSEINDFLEAEAQRVRQKRNLSEEQVDALRQTFISQDTNHFEADLGETMLSSSNSTAAQIKQTSKSKFKRFILKVVGLNKMGTQDLWLHSASGNIEAIREPSNRYDKNAIALYINGIIAGYVPRTRASKIASLMDSGYKSYVTLMRSGMLPSRKKVKDEWGGYSYEDDYEHMYGFAEIEMMLEFIDGITSEMSTSTKAPWSNIVLNKEVKVPNNSKKHEKKSSSILSYLTPEEAKELSSKGVAGLTDRQTQAMALLAQDMTRSDAAFEFGVKAETMKGYAKVIYQKLGVHSKKELVKYARNVLSNQELNDSKVKKPKDGSKSTKMISVSEDDTAYDGGWLLKKLTDAGFLVIDKRQKKGNLWVIADETAKPFMSKLEDVGYKFTYKAKGGKSTNGQSAWWLPCE